MPGIEEQLTEQFYRFEHRGRGWQVFAEPVSPEPPFLPFYGHCLPEAPAIDDGRKPTVISSFVRSLTERLSAPAIPPVIADEEEEPEPRPLIRDSIVELQTSLPSKLDISKEAFEQFLLNLSLCREPVAFELVGVPGCVSAQFAAGPDDAAQVRRQLQAYFPEAVFQMRQGALESAWETCEADDALAVEFGLASEFMFPLSTGKLDPFIGIIGALAELQAGELGLFQVLFQPAEHPWAETIIASVSHADGQPFFVNRPELTRAAEEKTARPLYAAVVRIAVRSSSPERTLEIARDLAGSLRVFARPNGNELIPLSNDDYPFEEHLEDVIRRQSRRSGMLLNIDELIGFVHIPSSAVRSQVFLRDTARTKAAPSIARQSSGVFIGDNVHAGESIPVKLTPEQRVRHIHIIGASGTGKSTLLFNLIRQDIENGEGIAVLDPHGDLVDRILGIIPANRIGDVVLVDPSDEQYSVGFNILSAHSDLEKNLLASDLVSLFKRLSESWGDQMGSVLSNAILALLESPRRGTLADLRRFLVEPAFRADFLKTVDDPSLLYYWHKGFPQLTGNKSIGPVLTRLQTFLTPKPIVHMVSQPENRLDFGAMMDTGKIFLAKLSQGLLGNENSYLLGTLLVSKFQQLAMARQARQIALRRDFWLYIDEFHNFISPSMAEILVGARKYRVGLVLAHHELRQLQRDSEVASAVMSHPYTRIVFRVGDDDARKLADGFAFFEARDLQSLPTGTAIARIERRDYDFNLSIPLPEEPDQEEAKKRRQEVITASREKYAVPRAEVETMLRRIWESEQRPDKPPSRLAAKEEKPPPPKPAPVEPAAPIPPPPAELPPPEAKPPAVSEGKTSTRPTDLGRGGPQHVAIQQRIKQAAEPLGFSGRIEAEILDRRGFVDVLLVRSDQTFACEIFVSRTTIDHDVGNVAKCFKAGFPTVVVICLDPERSEKIAAAVLGSLGPEMAARVIYSDPNQFIARLKTMELPAEKAPEAPRKSHGYNVRKSVPELSPEEHNKREGVTIRSIAEWMRGKA
jgi:hypothetical protein